MDKKHAYLIIAHNEFEVLQKLVSALDDEMHDIYIHFDAKVKEVPQITTKKSALYILPKRIDTCWGDITLLEVEYALWEQAHQQEEYAYYHLISGQHYPLRSAKEIYSYYNSLEERCIFQFMPTYEEEIDAKIRRYNIFANYMMSGKNKHCYKVGRFLWNLTLKPQKILDIRRYRQEQFYKASQWCSLSREGVEYMLSIKKRVLRKYRYTFCADEFFVLSELKNSPLANQCIYDDRILKVEFVASAPRIYMETDWNELSESGCLFARKFTQESMTLINKIEQHEQAD